MANQEHQKYKLLLLQDFFRRQTDPLHPASMAQILEYLDGKGVHAERKSVYADIAVLQETGMDILLQKGPGGGYYLASREFELPELKLLADAVLSSRFLTEKKSAQLIQKLANLTSVYDQGLLKRQMVVSGRVKSMNESIYYSIDTLQEAIAANKTITFRYFDWGIDKQRHYRPGLYEASPYGLCWTDDKYYLIAHSDRHGITHYRVDKMAALSMTDHPRQFPPEAKTLDLAHYGRKVFGMFSGPEETVKLRFSRALAGAAIDQFGKDCLFVPDGPDHFLFTAQVAVSPVFFSWLTGFGAQAQILYPQRVKEQFLAFCQAAAAQYVTAEA